MMHPALIAAAAVVAVPLALLPTLPCAGADWLVGETEEARKKQQSLASEPKAIMQLQLDILNGGGMAAFQRGIRDGTIRDGKSFDDVYQTLKWVSESGDPSSKILNSGSAETVLETIKSRTSKEEDIARVGLSGLALSDAGMDASFDFRQVILRWAKENPQLARDPMGVERQIYETGTLILSGIRQDKVQAPTYTQPHDISKLLHPTPGQ